MANRHRKSLRGVWRLEQSPNCGLDVRAVDDGINDSLAFHFDLQKITGALYLSPEQALDLACAIHEEIAKLDAIAEKKPRKRG